MGDIRFNLLSNCVPARQDDQRRQRHSDNGNDKLGGIVLGGNDENQELF